MLKASVPKEKIEDLIFQSDERYSSFFDQKLKYKNHHRNVISIRQSRTDLYEFCSVSLQIDSDEHKI